MSLNLLLLCQARALSTTVVSILHVDSMSYLIKIVFTLLIMKAMFYSIISVNCLSFPGYFLKCPSSFYSLLCIKLQENSLKIDLDWDAQKEEY